MSEVSSQKSVDASTSLSMTSKITIRVATKEDHERILEFCSRNKRRIPTEWGMGLIAERVDKREVRSQKSEDASTTLSMTAEIVGYVNLCVKTFIDPFVIEDGLGVGTNVRILKEMMTLVRGILIGMNTTSDVYFTASGKEFISTVEKMFGVKKFTDEKMFVAKI